MESTYTLRLKADYGKDADLRLDNETLDSQMEELKEFVEETRSLLKAKGFLA